MTELAKKVYEQLSEEPISKFELQERLAVWNEKGTGARCPSERDIRRAIAELRHAGFNIASSSDQKGYWLGDETAKQRTIAELRSRAEKLWKTADAIERGPDLGQLEMEV